MSKLIKRKKLSFFENKRLLELTYAEARQFLRFMGLIDGAGFNSTLVKEKNKFMQLIDDVINSAEALFRKYNLEMNEFQHTRLKQIAMLFDLIDEKDSNGPVVGKDVELNSHINHQQELLDPKFVEKIIRDSDVEVNRLGETSSDDITVITPRLMRSEVELKSTPTPAISLAVTYETIKYLDFNCSQFLKDKGWLNKIEIGIKKFVDGNMSVNELHVLVLSVTGELHQDKFFTDVKFLVNQALSSLHMNLQHGYLKKLNTYFSITSSRELVDLYAYTLR